MKIKSTISGFAILLTLTFALPNDIFGQDKGGPPSWAPANGYRAKTSHIYFPDYNFYFDIQESVYIYMKYKKWQMNIKLPSLYAGIDLSGAFRVELELDADSPQKYNTDHIIKYKVKDKEVKVKGKTNNNGKGKKTK